MTAVCRKNSATPVGVLPSRMNSAAPSPSPTASLAAMSKGVGSVQNG